MLQSAHVRSMRAIFHRYKRTVSRPQACKMYISLGSARIQYVARQRTISTTPGQTIEPKVQYKKRKRRNKSSKSMMILGSCVNGSEDEFLFPFFSTEHALHNIKSRRPHNMKSRRPTPRTHS